jgi:hypothetical protein
VNEANEASYKELEETFDKIETLDRTRKKIKLDKDLLGKGRSKQGSDGTVKWMRERKR